MDGKQFRLGNLLVDELTGALLRVSDLNSKTGTQGEYMQVTTYVIDRSKFPLPDGWKAIPIPLTEEWLIKFGFINDGANYFWLDDYYVTQNDKEINGNNDWCFYIKTSGNSGFFTSMLLTTTNHVHTLQNVYFSLKKEEIKIQ